MSPGSTWQDAEFFPDQRSRLLTLSDQQRDDLSMFGSERIGA